MIHTDRIRTRREVEAMAALDTVDLLAERVTNLLSHGRRMVFAQRYATYTDEPPKVLAGLAVFGEPKLWHQKGGAGFHVALDPGTESFGFAAYAFDGSATEVEAWQRYRAGAANSTDWSKRRRDMTRVDITGGLPGDGPAADDLLVIRAWNRDGVCAETVIAFDTRLLWAQRREAEER